MAIKKRRFTATSRRSAVKSHSPPEKKNIVEAQQNQQATQTPVVGGGFPQPLTPQPTVFPTPTPLPVSREMQAIQPAVDNLTQQPPMSQQSVQPTVEASSPSQELAPEKKSKLWLFVIVGLAVALMVGGVLFYFRSKAVKQAPKEEKVLPTPTQALVSPTVSPASESANLKVDYLQYEIRVLNGSGIRGEASKVKDSLEEEKFVVKDIDNADSSDYEKTVIKAKKDVPKEYLDKLKQMLGKTYVLDTEEELRESASVDVIIIIGSSKKP